MFQFNFSQYLNVIILSYSAIPSAYSQRFTKHARMRPISFLAMATMALLVPLVLAIRSNASLNAPSALMARQLTSTNIFLTRAEPCRLIEPFLTLSPEENSVVLALGTGRAHFDS